MVGAATEGKRAAGEAALKEVRSGMTLGLGTGSTVRHFLEALGRSLARGELEGIRGVPTSRDTESRCRELGVPLVELHGVQGLDLAVDGADEVTPELDLIKGMGGALLREKMVAGAAERFLVVVDDGKLVPSLGARSPLPVEVVPFAWPTHLPFFRALGAEPLARKTPEGELFVTDNGNYVMDLRFSGAIQDPDELEDRLRRRPGVVETGLFLEMAHTVLVGGEGPVRVLGRNGEDG